MDLRDILCDVLAVHISLDYTVTEAGELTLPSGNLDMQMVSDLFF